jgi:hypothetical protein
MLVCPTCSIDYEEGKKFCKHCGTALVRREAPTLPRPAEDPNRPGWYFGPPREVYLFILSELEAREARGDKDKYAYFQDREERGEVYVEFGKTIASDPSDRKYTMIMFDYPYDEPPSSLLPRRGVSFPAGYDLFDHWPGDKVDYKGPMCSHSELADTIDAIFTKLMGAPPDYVVQGEINAWIRG